MAKSIETLWHGYRFRSRLEARWAVFFDALRIKFEYEPEGFDLSNGKRYLPDFWLPRFHCVQGLYVEVKPTGGAFDKARQFVMDGIGTVLLAEGPPDPLRDYEVMFSGANLDPPEEVASWPHHFRSKYLPGGRNEDEYRLYCFPESEGCGDPVVLDAIECSRSARFEFSDADIHIPGA